MNFIKNSNKEGIIFIDILYFAVSILSDEK